MSASKSDTLPFQIPLKDIAHTLGFMDPEDLVRVLDAVATHLLVGRTYCFKRNDPHHKRIRLIGKGLQRCVKEARGK